MPFETQDKASTGMINVSEDSLKATFEEDDNVAVPETPSFAESFGASMILENEIGAIMTMDSSRLSRRGEGKYTEQGINYFNKAVEEGYNPEQIDDMFFVENKDQYNRLKKDIDIENLAIQTIQDAGGMGIATMFLAGALSPVGFFTGRTILKTTLAGAKALDIAKKAAKVGFLTSTAQEGILSASQATRTGQQSAINIGASTLLAGVLGGGVGKAGQIMGKARIAKMEKSTKEYLEDPDAILEIDDSIGGQVQHDLSVGAAKVPEKEKLTLGEESIFLSSNPIIKGVTQANLKTFGKTSLSTRLLQSPSLAVREFTEQIGDISLAFNKNVDKATDAGVLAHIRLYEGDLAKSSKALKDVYKQYLKAGEDNAVDAFKRITPGLAPEGKVPYSQFKEMVSDAYEGQLKNPADIGDDILLGTHVIRAAERASGLHKRISQEAFNVGMIKEGEAPKGTSAWLNHVWNPKKVMANLERAKTVFKKHYEDGFRADLIKARNIESKIDAGEKVNAKDTEFSRVTLAIAEDSESYIDESVEKTIRNITATESQIETLRLSPNDRGPFKERVINLPYREISFMLERDFEELMERASRTAAAEIELTRKFGTTKLDNENPIIASIKSDYEDLIKKAKTEKERVKLADQEKRDLTEVATFWDLVRGTYRANRGSYDEYARRSSAALRSVSFLTGMGQVVVSSALDPLIIARANGYGKLFKASIGQLLNKELKKLTKREIQYLGKGVNTYNASRLVRNFELGDPMAKGTAAERGLHNLTKSFGNINLINYWNDFFEKVALTTNSMRIYDNLGKFSKTGKLAAKEEFWMNKIGIGSGIRNEIAEEIKVHGFQTENGMPVFNTQNWSDKSLSREMNAILNKKIGQEVVTKSVGDAPIFMESSIGKALGQFMSFGFAANNKVLLSGLQQVDSRWLSTEVNFLLGGVLVYAAKQALSGRELPEDNTELFLNALDHSPELMLPMLVNRVADDMGMGLSNLTDNPRSFRSEKLIGTVLGANYNTVRKVTNATIGSAKNLATGRELSKRQIKDIRQSTFYNNVFYIKPLVNEIEKHFLDTAEKAGKRRRRKERRQKRRK